MRYKPCANSIRVFRDKLEGVPYSILCSDIELQDLSFNCSAGMPGYRGGELLDWACGAMPDVMERAVAETSGCDLVV